jgi:hypothetical protein
MRFDMSDCFFGWTLLAGSEDADASMAVRLSHLNAYAPSVSKTPLRHTTVLSKLLLALHN